MLSQDSRRKQMGMDDVVKQVMRFELECGELKTRQASDKEMEEIKHRAAKRRMYGRRGMGFKI